MRCNQRRVKNCRHGSNFKVEGTTTYDTIRYRIYGVPTLICQGVECGTRNPCFALITDEAIELLSSNNLENAPLLFHRPLISYKEYQILYRDTKVPRDAR